MPGKVKVKVVAGRSLPVMDRSSDTTDAYVEVKLGDTTFKTDVCRKSLNPAWNSDWFRFEADDLELQDEPLQVRVMDYDTYSANDAIGKVYIDLNPLLLPQPGQRPASLSENASISVSATGGTVMSGWLPVYDTMHGIRGEVNLVVKVELFSDLNKFRQSSCGVQFFCCSEVPEGYKAQFLPGFVEELVVNDDPEYKWIDKIRTPRASNEARQLLFMKLSGEVRRKVGLKALELGGNAVIGYRQCFDLEGESGIVVRGIGTAVTLLRLQQQSAQEQLGDSVANAGSTPTRVSRENSAGKECSSSPGGGDCLADSVAPTTPGVSSGPITFHSSTPSLASAQKRAGPKDTGVFVGPQKSLDTEQGASAGSSGSEKMLASLKGNMKSSQGDHMSEYPFFTMTKFPPGFLIHIGGMVSSKSIKLLEELNDKEENDARESWWVEIRQEVRSHAKALGCNMIVGYQEKTVIWDDVLILSSSGTAAICNLDFMADLDSSGGGGQFNQNRGSKSQTSCQCCHIPYSEASVPFPIKLSKCAICGYGKVPEILLTTIEPPNGVEICGQGGFIQARVLRLKKDLKGENNAREVSDALPFMEYEIHRQLVNKLKVKGMNAIFGLSVTLSLSDRSILGLATGTAVYLSSLPTPQLPRVLNSAVSHKSLERTESKQNDVSVSSHLAKVQAKLKEKVEANKEYFGLTGVKEYSSEVFEGVGDDDGVELDLSAGNKDTCILEVDDIEDADIVESLLDAHPPQGFQMISSHTPVGVDPSLTISNCQTFSQVWRGKIPSTCRDFSCITQYLLSAVCFKLRRMQPCLVSSISWNLDMDDENEVQICLSGVAVSFMEKDKKEPTAVANKEQEATKDDMMFCLDEIHSELGSEKSSVPKSRLSRIPPYFFASVTNPMFAFGVNITHTPFVPGALIEHHMGNLNFFFIRESTSVRENGGLSTFVQRFMCEVLGLLRSHVSCLGGNAVTSYFMSSCLLSHSPHKNQAQCLINVGGDIVRANYINKND